MKFAAAQWLWALLALLPLWYFFERGLKLRKERFAKFADPAVWSAIAPGLNWAAAPRKLRIWIAASVMMILALARPQWGQHEETLKVSGLDIVLALDVSNSMEVEDVVPNRLKKMKHLARALLDRLEGDRVAVVAFAGSAYVASPLTTDLSYIQDTIEILGPKMIANQGTDLGAALTTSLQVLDRAAEDTHGGSRAIILISDGEDHEAKGAALAQKIRDSGQKLYILGVGTEQGGPIPLRDESGQLRGYKRDRKNEPIVSAFNSGSLSSLANQAGGKYWTTSATETELSELATDLGSLNRTDIMERRYVIFEDRYQYPLALAVFLLLIELSVPARTLVAILLLCFWIPSRAEATPVESYIKNQDGLKAFQEGQIDEAQRKFGEAQALDPGSPELLFNQGVARLKKSDAEGAVQGFTDSARESARLGNPRLEGASLYNLGLAYHGKGESDLAARAYAGAIGKAAQAHDSELEQMARKNLRLLRQQEEQQKSQKQEKKDEQKPNQKEDQKQDQKQEQAQGQNQEPKKEQYQQPKKQAFQSAKLNQEDAKRVMEELSGRERELQARLKGKRGGAPSGGKDW